jgi:hypothetical protein
MTSFDQGEGAKLSEALLDFLLNRLNSL